MYELADFLHTFKQRGIAFESICDGMDTSTAFGECMYMVAGAFAHLERCILIERTREGMAAAKARGAKFGRKRVLNGEEFREARFLIHSGMSVANVAEHLGIGRSTLYRYLQAA
jgi:DNA invertase Pin-like site-specific DNA recombinase